MPTTRSFKAGGLVGDTTEGPKSFGELQEAFYQDIKTARASQIDKPGEKRGHEAEKRKTNGFAEWERNVKQAEAAMIPKKLLQDGDDYVRYGTKIDMADPQYFDYAGEVISKEACDELPIPAAGDYPMHDAKPDDDAIAPNKRSRTRQGESDYPSPATSVESLDADGTTAPPSGDAATSKETPDRTGITRTPLDDRHAAIRPSGRGHQIIVFTAETSGKRFYEFWARSTIFPSKETMPALAEFSTMIGTTVPRYEEKKTHGIAALKQGKKDPTDQRRSDEWLMLDTETDGPKWFSRKVLASHWGMDRVDITLDRFYNLKPEKARRTHNSHPTSGMGRSSRSSAQLPRKVRPIDLELSEAETAFDSESDGESASDGGYSSDETLGNVGKVRGMARRVPSLTKPKSAQYVRDLEEEIKKLRKMLKTRP